MRQLFFVIAVFFSIISAVFVFLPLGTLALLPVGIALIFGFLALKKSDLNQAKRVKLFLAITIFSLIIIVGKTLFFPDTVDKDPQFETQKRESKDEAQKELEELE
jgi:cytochrome bd-type quinol oxidase subunit 2